MVFSKLNWTEKEYKELLEYLNDNSEEKYKQFIISLVPDLDNILGVKIPLLRSIAKQISKGNYTEFLNIVKHDYYEEIMIKGFVIRYIDLEYGKTKQLITEFLPYVTNWAICDSFCSKFKCIKNNEEDFLKFIQECINTNKEYYIRFGVLMLKTIYLNDEYIDEVFKILNKINHNGYYVKMSVAWTLSECYIKYEDITLKYLNNNNLDKFTYNKTLQKIIESTRVEKEKKNIIREMRRY